jgi:hypothetical protein
MPPRYAGSRVGRFGGIHASCQRAEHADEEQAW